MSARRIVACVLALAALLLWAAPASAAEASPSAPQLYAGVARLNDELALMGQGSSTLGLPGKVSLSELRFQNRDGYTISVVAFGQTVALSVSRARTHDRRDGNTHRKIRDRVSATTYLAHGKVTPTSIVASFGDRGRIAVRFHPFGHGVHATRKAGCKRRRGGAIADLGVFAGELRFEGEGGYTSAQVHRMPGRSVDFAALLACLFGLSPGRHAALPPPSAPLGIHLPGLVAAGLDSAPSSPSVPTHPSTGPVSTTLVANSKSALARTVFAAQVRGKSRSHFLALDQVSEGSIGVVRMVYVRGAPSAFAADDTLSRATATPPRPFSGAATLEHGPQSAKSWTGSLAVSFLGAPHVLLAGPPFSALLARGF
jgi:hypothetical protein